MSREEVNCMTAAVTSTSLTFGPARLAFSPARHDAVR